MRIRELDWRKRSWNWGEKKRKKEEKRKKEKKEEVITSVDGRTSDNDLFLLIGIHRGPAVRR